MVPAVDEKIHHLLLFIIGDSAAVMVKIDVW